MDERRTTTDLEEFRARAAFPLALALAIAAVAWASLVEIDEPWLGERSPAALAVDPTLPSSGIAVVLGLLLAMLSWSLAGRTQRVEALVEERTHDFQLATAELRRTAAELERSNAELRQFAHLASHDLKAPLRTISSFSQLLEIEAGDCLPSECQDYLHRIARASQRMSALLDHLMEAAEVGSRQVDTARIELTDPLATALEALDADLRSARASVVHGPLPEVVGNRELLAQVFQNLLANSLRYRSEAPPEIAVTARREAEVCTVSVRDNGVGIREEDRHAVFEIFRRGNVADATPGTGAGLAICRRAIERLGGRIWAEPADAGALIRFSLPAADAPPAASTTAGSLR